MRLCSAREDEIIARTMNPPDLHPSVIGLGELLWDCFPDRRLPGGAPANVAFHAQQLGLTAAVATRVGTDPLGDELCAFLRDHGLGTNLVQREGIHGTGTVTVAAGPAGNSFTFLENSAWDFLEATPDWLAAMSHAQAICFGTLAQRKPTSRDTIHRCLEVVPTEATIVYDINLRAPFFERAWIERSLAQATIVKLNDDEVRVLGPLLASQPMSDRDFARWLLATYPLEAVCITRGAAGALAVTQNDVFDVPGVSVTVADTVGAGDAFTAALIWGRLSAWPWDRVVRLANQVGALVASCPGAMPALRAEFAAAQAEFARG
jgi:fructokinase